MAGRYLPSDGSRSVYRRSVSFLDQLTEEDTKDPTRLLEVIKRLSRRLSDLEASQPPEYIDFQKVVTSGTTYVLEHGWTSPVRFWPVYWSGSTAPRFDYASNANPKQLSVLATCTGTVILRVEKAQL